MKFNPETKQFTFNPEVDLGPASYELSVEEFNPIAQQDGSLIQVEEQQELEPPRTVTKRQLCLWLFENAGITYDSLLSMMPTEVAKIELQTAAVIEIDNPYVQALAKQLGVDADQVFRAAVQK